MNLTNMQLVSIPKDNFDLDKNLFEAPFGRAASYTSTFQ